MWVHARAASSKKTVTSVPALFRAGSRAPMGFGDLGRRAIYFQGAGEH